MYNALDSGGFRIMFSRSLFPPTDNFSLSSQRIHDKKIVEET